MVWEPATIELSNGGSRSEAAVDPDFPIEYDEPRLAELTWGRDGSHFPVALAPLAGDYARVVGSTLNGWQDMFDGFPQRWHTAVWHGYVYYAFEPNATPEEWPARRQRAIELCRDRATVTEAYWRDEVVPELRDMFAELGRIEPTRVSRVELAEAWQAAWRLVERAWKLHMTASIGPMQILVDLRAAYADAHPDASPADAFRLIGGSRHELVEMELETDLLAEAARGLPAVAAALRAGVRDLAELRSVTGGDAFVAAVDAFLDRHGHMGQTSDDLTQPSFGEAPGLLLAAVTTRVDHPAEPALDRAARLAREADRAAASTRVALADRPAALAEFEGVLEIAKAIGILSDVHNYWIDRAVQAHFRRLVLRVGGRLVEDGVIDRADDIFYLRRGEVGDLLRARRDMRAVVAARRAAHDREKAMRPPNSIGEPADESSPIDQVPDPGAPEPVLHGVGASRGVVRGTARVVAGVDEFERIRPGDIIVGRYTNPSWIPVFTIAGGLVTDLGGLTSHPAVVAREFALPAVVGTGVATTRIRDGQEIEIDGTSGTVRLF